MKHTKEQINEAIDKVADVIKDTGEFPVDLDNIHNFDILEIIQEALKHYKLSGWKPISEAPKDKVIYLGQHVPQMNCMNPLGLFCPTTDERRDFQVGLVRATHFFLFPKTPTEGK